MKVVLELLVLLLCVHMAYNQNCSGETCQSDFLDHHEVQFQHRTEKPVLTLPAQESAWIIEGYKEAKVILEYGSGGSTIVAADLEDKIIFSVESDIAWLLGMEDWLIRNPGQSPVHFHYADIGPTVAWGRAKGCSKYENYSGYPISVWDREDFVEPDTVLIDGRFRVACFLTVALRCTSPVTVYYDDYIPRKEYHIVEKYAELVETRGRMAKFIVKPLTLTGKDLTDLIPYFAKQQ